MLVIHHESGLYFFDEREKKKQEKKLHDCLTMSAQGLGSKNAIL